MLKVKVCGMTDPVNTEEIVRTGPDMIGFIFFPGSKRYVGMDLDGSLFNNIPSGILKAGVFVGEQHSVIIDTVNLYGLDMVQLHGNESPDYCDYLKKNGLIIIKAFGISNSFNFMSLEKYINACDYFLFDSKTRSHGGSGHKFNWAKINEYAINKPFLLGGGIGPADVSLIKKLNHYYLYGVDLNSCFEINPGIKDIKKVKDFIDEIRS
jgi:phosphoribosylanthranilate isomerase